MSLADTISKRRIAKSLLEKTHYVAHGPILLKKSGNKSK
jgi:hypothetical protein